MRSAVLASFFVVVARGYDNGALHSRLPPMGWSSWVGLGQNAEHAMFDWCDEESVKLTIDAFVTLGFKDAGYSSVRLDDCWAGGRDDSGKLFPEKAHFPNGMKPIVDYVHDQNLAFGMYTCGGNETCVGGRPASKGYHNEDAGSFAEWGVDIVKMDWCNTDGLDPKTEYSSMSRALNATGRPIHFNMCEWGRDNPWEWSQDIAQSWRATGDHTGNWASTKKIIKEVHENVPAFFTGRPFGWNDMDMLQTGNYEQSAHANGKLSNMTATEYKTEFSMWAIMASPLIVTTPLMNCSDGLRRGGARLGSHAAPRKSMSDDGVGIKLIEEFEASVNCTEGKYGWDTVASSFWAAKDCQAYFEIWGAHGAEGVGGDGAESWVCLQPEGLSAERYTCELYNAKPITCTPWISDLQKEILFNKEVIAVNQQETPQGRPLPEGDRSVWSRQLAGGDVAVAFFNEGDKALNASVKFAALGWPRLTRVKVRDLWEHADLGVVVDRFPEFGHVTVKPHATVMLRLSPVELV